MLSTLSIKSSRPLLPQAGLLRLVYGLFVACGVSQSAIVPLLPHLSARYGLSASETALLLAVPGLATLAVSVPAGMAADRYGARRVTLAAGGLLCVSCLAQAGQSLALLMAGRIAFGIAFGVVWTTGVAWLAEVDDGAGAGGSTRLGPAVTCSSVGVMFGPAVGGLLGQIAGPGLPFVLIAAVTAIVVAPLALGSTSAGERPAAPEGTRRRRPGGPRRRREAPRGAVLALLRRPGFAAAAGGLVVAGAVSGSSQLLITAGLHADGVSTGRIGLAFSAAAVGYIAVSSAIVKLGRRAQTLRFNALATALLALAMLPALASGAVAALVVALVLCSVPRAAVSTIAYALPSVGDGDGFVIGILNGAWAAAMVLTPVLAGALEQHGGAQLGYLAVIVPCAAIAVALIAGARPWNVAARMTAYYSSS
jgi:predicted MFS family arabinose efflux permease